MGLFLISLILIVLTATQILSVITTGSELAKLRQSVKSLRAELAKVKASVSAVKYSRNESSRPRVVPTKMSGDLDLYHKGQTATVKAVFRPRRS